MTGAPVAGPVTGGFRTEDLDPLAPDVALGATGLLAVFNRAGVLSSADVHVATRLAELTGEIEEIVVLAAALTVRGTRNGSACTDLAEVHRLDAALPWPEPRAWEQAVRRSPLVGDNGPLRWEYDLLYLTRYRQQEEQVRADLETRNAGPPPAVDVARLDSALDRLFRSGPPGAVGDPDGAPGHLDDGGQREAAATCATRWTTVLGGGPGTGKTTTIARVLALLADQPGGGQLRIALAAPTGKAAARLQSTVRAEAQRLDAFDQRRLTALTASTLQRLLGWKPGHRNRFRHDRDNRLPYDVVVVDEMSMVSLTLMARLLAAVRPDSRLILVGDPDQLPSVDAGTVLADLVAGITAGSLAGADAGPAVTSGPAVIAEPGTTPGPAGTSGWGASGGGTGVVLLRRTWRFGQGIAELADAVRDGDADRALRVVTAGEPSVTMVESAGAARIQADVVGAAQQTHRAAAAGDAAGALDALESHRLLCAHRTGPRGVGAWSSRIERWLAETDVPVLPGDWYVGRPVLITANDYGLGLFNGDTGVAIRWPDGMIRVVFRGPDGLADHAPDRLAQLQTVYAMTVHRGQGSQFRRVTFVLPEHDSPLATRELLYTALTRAQSAVTLIGTADELRTAIQRQASRASGLRRRLGG